MELLVTIFSCLFWITLIPMLLLYDYFSEKSGNYDRAFKRNLQKKLLKNKLKNKNDKTQKPL